MADDWNSIASSSSQDGRFRLPSTYAPGLMAPARTKASKLSKPDYDVWVLTCKNATYRIGRYPDMAAKVEKLK